MKYKTLFDRITPPKTDDEMIQLVHSRGAETIASYLQSTRKKRSFCKPAICAAAAAALSIGVTAAGASCGWDFSKLFEEFFSRISSESHGYIDTGIENQLNTADLSQMGISLDRTVDFDYGSVTFTGAVADSSTVMVMYDLSVNETALDEYHSKFGSSKSLWAELGADEIPVGCNLVTGYGTKLGANGDCSFTVVYSYQNGFLTKDSVIEPEFSTFTMYSSDNSLLEMNPEEPIKLSITLDFMNTECVSVSPDTEVKIDNYKYYLEDVVITPLSIQWYAKRGDKTGKLEGETDPLIYRFRDGTEITNYHVSSATEYNGNREFFSVLLDKPINPADLTAITIGGCEINLNAA